MRFSFKSAGILVFSGLLVFSGWSGPCDIMAQEKPATPPAPATKTDQAPQDPKNEAAQSSEAADPDKTGDSPVETARKDDGKRPDFNSGKLTFEFKNTEWSKVIRWFADEAKMDLNMAVTPEGSFSYSSNGEFTLLEAMDIINSFLIREQGFILLRHGNLLIVHDLNNEIPPTLIETIPLSELDNRGEFELTQTEFDVSGFDGQKFSQEIEPLVRDDQGGKQLFLESSNVLFVRETGGRLRLIRKYLEMAKSISSARQESVKIVELKYITPEEVMTVATELIPLDEENSFVDEESGEKLKVVVQSFGNKFILQGTGKTLKRFTDLVEILDKESTTETTAQGLAQPITKRYPVAADRELILQVLRVLMAGTEGLRLALAEESGEIIAYATPEVHKMIEQVLGTLQSDSSDFRVFRLNEYDADSMIEILNKMYGITGEGDPLPNQPIFMADPIYSDQIIAKAKPSQLEAIKKLVESIDPPIGEGGNADKNYIELPYRGKQADMAIQLIEDYYSALGRKNKLNVIRSKSASESIDRIRKSPGTGELKPINRDPGPAGTPDQPGELPKAEPDSQKKTSDAGKKTTGFQYRSGRYLNVNALTPTQDNKQDDQEKPKVQAKKGEMQSVDGAPILIRENSAGLMIISDDLKALAEIKRMLDDHDEALNRPGLPTIIELKHRKAIEMKDLLEMFLGLSSGDSGGGGGGGLGNLVGGMAQNALGGVAGQMVGGLLGGGGGGDSRVTTSDLLTGDVRIDADALKNVLLVQANPIDLETIMEYINYFDTDGAEQQPSLDGRTYAIRVQYREAAQLAETIKAQFPDRIKSPKQQSQGNNNAQAQQLQMLQQMLGGRGRGRGGSSQKTVEQSEPKMTIGVDEQMNSILVTGPEFLYEQVYLIVQQLDTPEAVRNGTVVVMGLKNVTPDALKEAINAMQSENGSSNSRTSSAGSGSPTGSPFGGSSSPFGGFRGFNPQMFQRPGGSTSGFSIPGRSSGGRSSASPRSSGGRGGRGGR